MTGCMGGLAPKRSGGPDVWVWSPENLENKAREVCVLGQIADMLAHIGLIDRQLLAGPVGGRETHLLQYPLHHGLKTPGADVLHVAASDLGQSMGNPPVSEVRKVMSEVIPRVRAGGKHVGVGGNNPADTDGVAEFVRQGANFVTVSGWGLLRIAGENFLRDVKSAL